MSVCGFWREYILVPPGEDFSVCTTVRTSWWVIPQQLWGSFVLVHLYGYSWKPDPSNSGEFFFWCTSMATPATLGYPSNSGVVGKYLSLGLSISHSGSLSHSHTHTLVLPLTHNHSTSLSFTLIHSNKNDRGKLPFLQTSRLPLMNESTTSAFTLTKMIGKNYLFCRDPGSH